jgi:hypothetical protein
MVLLNCETAFESYEMALFTRVLGMDAIKAQGICDGALEVVRIRTTIFIAICKSQKLIWVSGVGADGG